MVSPRFGRIVVATAIVALAFNLRTAVGSVGVLLERIQADLDMSSSWAGVLTSFPVLAFAAGGYVAPALTKRWGLHVVAVACLSAVIIGQVLRANADSTASFFLVSVIALLGSAVGNVILPPLARTHFPDRVGLISSLYGAALMGSGAISAAATTPVANAADSWRAGMILWAIVALVCLVPWIGLLGKNVRASVDHTEHIPYRVALSSPLTWLMLIMFGTQSANAYIQMGWYPTMLKEAGIDETTAGIQMGIIGGVGLLMTLFLPLLMKSIGPWLPLFFGVLNIIGWGGLLFLGGDAVLLWSILLGIGSAAFTWTLTMVAQRTRTQAGTTTLSAMTQSPGYLLAAIGPVSMGILHDQTGSWDLSYWLLMASAVVIAVAGTLIVRSAPLEDRLAERGR